jgi:hypothetical protein
MATASLPSTSTANRELRLRRWMTAVLATCAAGLVGAAVAQLILGNPLPLALLAGLVVATIVWFAPWTGVVVLVVIATVIEQFSLVSEGTFSDFTDHLVLFQSLNAAGLGGIYATPFEMFLALLLAIWVIKGFATHSLRVPRSALAMAVGAFALLVAFGWVRGVTGGGSFQDALLELRPWLYMTISFIAASQLLTRPKHVVVLLTVLAIGIGIKSLQGIVTLLTHFQSRPQAILAHEESFFFGLFLGVVTALWLIPIPGPLRRVMTLLAPFVLIADVGNQRRTAWAIAALVIFTVMALCFWGFPERRRTIIALGAIGCVIAGVYWLKFSNDPGLLGQPARAVLSQLAPQSRDQQSNQYRTIENVNLGIGIRQTTPFGTGFGHPIPQSVPNVDISNIDSFISYLPHNGVLYVWLRLGLPGILAFWMMVGIGLMTAANMVRRRANNTVALLLGITMAAALVAYVVQGYYDMGLYWFRIAIVIGCLLGATQAASRFQEDVRVSAQPGAASAVKRKVGERDLRSAA